MDKNYFKTNQFIAHNAAFEYKWFLHRGIDINIIHDTKILAHLYDERLPLSLEELYLYFDIDKSYKHGETVTQLEGKALADYNTRDTYNTYRLYEILYPKLSDVEKEVYHQVLMPAVKNIAKIELAGIQIDMKYLTKAPQEVEVLIKDLNINEAQGIKEFSEVSIKPFNINSPIHKKLLVYDILNYPILQRSPKTGEPSTEAEILEATLKRQHIYEKHKEDISNCSVCKNSTLSKVIKYSQYTGWIENFLNPLQKFILNGRIYPNLLMMETSTGRIKSNKPNLQNCVKTFLRKLFISKYPEGVISESDYSGIELRLMASLANDKILIKGFLEGDPHEDTAKLIFGKKTVSKQERDIGKTWNYAIIYGSGGHRLSVLTGLERKRINKMLQNFWNNHNCIRTYHYDWVDNDIVYSPTGMRRHWTKETIARNFPIQNSAMIIMLKGINKVMGYLDKIDAGEAILTIHDSLLIDWKSQALAEKHLPVIEKLLCEHEMSWIQTPITVDSKIGKNWWDMQKFIDK